MTELTEKINALYEKYGEISSEPRKRGLGDLFVGWFSGRGKKANHDDTGFMSDVEALTDAIVSDGDGEDALSASLLILSQPQSKKFSEVDIVYAAMYKNVTKLVPLLNDGDVVKVSEAADKVKKQYRFPVYKELVAALKERLDK